MSDVKSGKVLVIDDDAMNRDVLEAFLGGDYQVLLARNGHQGLSMAQTDLPDLILLDVRMPDITGFEVCEQLRAHPDTHKIPVMFITGYDSSEDIRRGKEAGARAFLVRPFDGDELLRLVAELIEEGRTGTSS